MQRSWCEVLHDVVDGSWSVGHVLQQNWRRTLSCCAQQMLMSMPALCCVAAARQLHLLLAGHPALRIYKGEPGPPAVIKQEEAAVSKALKAAFRQVGCIGCCSCCMQRGHGGCRYQLQRTLLPLPCICSSTAIAPFWPALLHLRSTVRDKGRAAGSPGC